MDFLSSSAFLVAFCPQSCKNFLIVAMIETGWQSILTSSIGKCISWQFDEMNRLWRL